MSRVKYVIVGHNETYHNFTKLLLIPDAILVHKIPEDNTSCSDTHENQDHHAHGNIGRWDQGQVHHRIKNMTLEVSSVIRGSLEIGNVIISQGNVPPRLFAYTDGGSGDIITNFRSV